MGLLLISALTVSAQAAEFTAPPVPDSGAALMPRAESFGEGLWLLLRDLLPLVRPDLREALQTAAAIVAAAVLISLLHPLSEQTKWTVELAGACAVGASLLLSANSMIRLGADTIRELTEYGRLLLPVMTGALAAQGHIGSSAALYAGTAAFSAVLGRLLSGLFVKLIYMFLALGLAAAATGEEMLKKLRDLLKNAMSWCLKTLLTLFVSYMSLTGVISGTTDAAALKAARTAISTAVPVVGGILSDASEAVLVGVGLAKNAAGIYGILAVLAILAGPFLKIGIHYLLLKLTGILCSAFTGKRVSELIGDFSSAMGLLLGMTGSASMLVLISTICFLRGAA